MVKSCTVVCLAANFLLTSLDVYRLSLKRTEKNEPTTIRQVGAAGMRPKQSYCIEVPAATGSSRRFGSAASLYRTSYAVRSAFLAIPTLLLLTCVCREARHICRISIKVTPFCDPLCNILLDILLMANVQCEASVSSAVLICWQLG